jgi:RNA polymerase sigma-70 factor (ECF subfamily)
MSVVTIRFQSDSNSELVRAVLAGHPGAIRKLYDDHAPRVARLLRRILGEDPDLPDLLQEVFLHALRGLKKLDDPEILSSWLGGIAINVARATIRSRSRRRSLRERFLRPEEPVLPANADTSFALTEAYRLLAELSADERIAFSLRHLEGMTVLEAAEATQTSPSTFKRRLARAEEGFGNAAKGHALLSQWMEDGTRWRTMNEA